MREKRRGKRFLAWALVLMMTLSLLPMSALAAEKGSNYFYFMSSTENDAIVIATKVLHEGDDNVTDFGDVVVPVDAKHGVAGWYADKGLTNPVTELSYDAARTMPVPLYPKIEEGFWVTFESNGGSYIAPQFFVNEASSPTSAPSRYGYDFQGWYSDEKFTDMIDFAAIKEPTTVYAKWEARNDTKYTVIYWQENADDDDFSYVESEYRYGTSGTETNVATDKSYDGFAVQDIEQETIAGDGTTIINVYYKRNEYDVIFYEAYEDEYGSLTGEKVELEKIHAKYGADIAAQWPGGVWRTTENRSGRYQAYIKVMPLNGATFYKDDLGEKTGHADYFVEKLNGEENEYVLDHSDYGAPLPVYGEDKTLYEHIGITKEDCYPIEGFEFEKIESDPDKRFWDVPDAKWYDEYRDAKFYYTRNTYKIIYMNQSENPEKETPYKYQAAISDAAGYQPQRGYGIPENYSFAGWYTDKECTVAYNFNRKSMPAHNITVYAKWVPPVCSVRFIAYGKEVSTLADVPYGASVSMPVLSDWLHEDDTFLGWFYDADGTIPFKTDTQITEDTVLYAQIDDGSSYTVTYDANGGTGAVNDTYRYARNRTAMVLSGSGLTAPSGRSSFQGWNTAADGSGTMYRPSEPIRVSDNITLYAIWKRSYNPPYTPPTVEIPDEDALGLNTDDHFAYIIGYPDGTVQPNGQITRAEATTIFFRLLTDESRENFWSTDNGYPDVSAGQWYNNAISTMTKAGIVDGYPDGTFRPDAPITRAEMAKIISLFAKLDKSESRFSDIAGHWAERYIELAAGNGWIEGYPDGTFGPQRNITRAETATMINRVLERVPSAESRLLSRDVMQIWPDSNPGDWFYLAMQEASNSHDYERNAKWAAADEQWTALRANRDWKMLEK